MNKIGEIIKFDNDVEIKTYVGKKQYVAKKGDIGIVDSHGNILIISGPCNGKVLAKQVEVKGYEHDDISEMILNRLCCNYGINYYFKDEGIELKEVKNEISDLLSEILR